MPTSDSSYAILSSRSRTQTVHDAIDRVRTLINHAEIFLIDYTDGDLQLYFELNHRLHFRTMVEIAQSPVRKVIEEWHEDLVRYFSNNIQYREKLKFAFPQRILNDKGPFHLFLVYK